MVVRRKRAVIVDDDPIFAELVAEMLRSCDLQPIINFNMEDGLDTMRASHPDVALVDIFMPGIGGVEGVRMLKSEMRDIKVIAMSGGWPGMSPNDAMLAMQKLGADSGLIKPFTMDDLRTVLDVLGIVDSSASGAG